MDYSAYVPLAKALAHKAHAGQGDKAGDRLRRKYAKARKMLGIG